MQYNERILTALVKKTPRHYIKNAFCQTLIWPVNDFLVPLTIAQPSDNNSFVCSLRAQYIDYGYKEIDIELGDKKWLSWGCKQILKLLDLYLVDRDFDHNVLVNNWLVATNLHPAFGHDELKDLTQQIIQKYPNKAVVFRSVSEVWNADLLEQLEKIGYQKIMSRQIYTIDTKDPSYLKKKAYKKDLRLWKKQQKKYTWREGADVPVEDLPKIRKLYNDLYLKKYARLNPQFTPAFFKQSFEEKWLNYHVLYDNETQTPQAVVGYFHRRGIMTTPIIGYNFEKSKKEGFYRLLTLKIVEEGQKIASILHRSSGASHFKRLRGAKPSFEYNLVYTKHLPFKRRYTWDLLEQLTKHVAGPLLQKYEL